MRRTAKDTQETGGRGEPGKQRLQVFIDPRVDKFLNVAAAQRETTKSQLVEDAIRAFLRMGREAA